MKQTPFLTALAPVAALAQLLTPPDGPYQVTWTNIDLTDDGRVDPFNTTEPRRMMVSHFQPVDKAQCSKTGRVPYLTPKVIAIMEPALDSYIGHPASALTNLEMEVCTEGPEKQCCSSEGKKNPTVLFSPGLSQSRLFYSSIAQHLASLGLEVFVMDHPYEANVVEFPNGDTIFGGRVDQTDPASMLFGLDVRAGDLSFVLDRFCISSAVFMGHSFGGAAAIASLNEEPRIAGAVNLDGALYEPTYNNTVSKPFVFFGATDHNSTDIGTDFTWKAFFDEMEAETTTVWARDLYIQNSIHYGYSDLPLIGDVSGHRSNAGLVRDFFGPIEGSRMMPLYATFLGDFVNFVLGGKDAGVLAQASDDWSEVSFLRTLVK